MSVSSNICHWHRKNIQGTFPKLFKMHRQFHCINYFRVRVWVALCQACPSVSGLFHLIHLFPLGCLRWDYFIHFTCITFSSPTLSMGRLVFFWHFLTSMSSTLKNMRCWLSSSAEKGTFHLPWTWQSVLV